LKQAELTFSAVKFSRYAIPSLQGTNKLIWTLTIDIFGIKVVCKFSL